VEGIRIIKEEIKEDTVIIEEIGVIEIGGMMIIEIEKNILEIKIIEDNKAINKIKNL